MSSCVCPCVKKKETSSIDVDDVDVDGRLPFVSFLFFPFPFLFRFHALLHSSFTQHTVHSGQLGSFFYFFFTCVNFCIVRSWEFFGEISWWVVYNVHWYWNNKYYVRGGLANPSWYVSMYSGANLSHGPWAKYDRYIKMSSTTWTTRIL